MHNQPAIHKSPFPPGPKPRTIISSGFINGAPPLSSRPAAVQPHAIPLPFPAIEELPEFVANIDSAQLQHGARHYNASICRFGGHTYIVYRFETFDAVSKLGICELDSEWMVIGDKELNIPVEVATHYEDPKMTVVGDKLVVVFAHVKLGVPPMCRQRVAIIGTLADPSFARIGFLEEVPAPFGNIHGIEKNWAPFELPSGKMGLVYGQKPRLVIEVDTQAGHWTQQMIRAPRDSSLSGRTPPLRVSEEYFLEFVGGHIPFQQRAARYWFGAQLFTAAAPHRVVKATKEPLVWGTEASLTIFCPRPYAGHPCCIFPSGVMKDGDDVIISCGVNDSYIALLRYNVADLIGGMEDIA